MPMTAQRSNVFITGAGSGLGAAAARKLASEGWRLAIADLDAVRAQSVATSLHGQGHLAIQLDVSDEDSVASAFKIAEQAMGPIRALVNAAGVILTERALEAPPRFWETPTERWDRTLAINLRGSFLPCVQFMRHRVQAPIEHGRIILFSSISGQTGGSYADYAASKAGLLGFMRVAARECAPLGITMNAIAPGMIDTPMLRQRLAPGAVVDPQLVPVGRLGQPEDIASVVSFIASEQSAFITGATFDVNGGQRMQ